MTPPAAEEMDYIKINKQKMEQSHWQYLKGKGKTVKPESALYPVL